MVVTKIAPMTAGTLLDSDATTALIVAMLAVVCEEAQKT